MSVCVCGRVPNCSIIPSPVNVQWSETGEQPNENGETEIHRENTGICECVCLCVRVCDDVLGEGENNTVLWIHGIRSAAADISIISDGSWNQ